MVAGQTILGLNSRAFEFSVRNSDIYTGVGGYARTQADLVMFQQFIGRDRYIAYVPYGPEIEPSEENQGRFLEELSEYLRSYLDPGCVAIRYDLNCMSRWCKAEDFDESGRWRELPKKGIPGNQSQFRNGRAQPAKVEYERTARRHDRARSHTLGRAHSCLDETQDALQHPPVAEKGHRGAGGAGALDVWYAPYLETARRNGLHINDIRHFRSVFSSVLSNEVGVRLLTAWHQNEPLAAMFLVRSEHRATYLYGASSSKMRLLMPTYALPWAAIFRAKAAGCLES